MLKRELSISMQFGGNEITLSTDLDATKENLISFFREQLTNAIEEVKAEYPDRILQCEGGRFYLQDMYIRLHVMREETPAEAMVRIKREEKAKKAREKKIIIDRKKDLDTIAKLASKHGFEVKIPDQEAINDK